jgi:surface antigen
MFSMLRQMNLSMNTSPVSNGRAGWAVALWHEMTRLCSKMLRKIAPALIALTLVTGCTTDGIGPKQGFGTLGGAAAGGLLGSQIGGGTGKLVAVGAGTLLGAFLGSEIGSSLDRADQAYAGRAVQQAQAAPIGQKIVWNNPESGNSGVIVPTREGRQADTNAYCREYQQTVTVGGRTQQAFGQACQQPDGSWKIVQ